LHIAVILLVAITGGLLCLRQERLRTMHQMAQLQTQMEQQRQETWDLQVRIAQRTEPRELERALQRAGVRVAPMTSEADADAGSVRTQTAAMARGTWRGQ
jgi:uncharacterized iron-regulated membrane protein